MSIGRYPQYKKSNIPWLGDIPASWDILPLFSRFSERKESNKGMKNSNLLSLSYGRVVKKDIDTLEGLLPASFETYQVVHRYDIVFRLTDLQNDKRSLRSAMVDEEGIITSAYLAVVAYRFDSTFANYLFRAYDLMKVFYSMGGGLRQSMKYNDMKWLPIIAPSIVEQTQIARFLDHETAKIDALIREQERLIELLQEKRQAVISHAVTKGLDPDVPMKDSGVEWLGEVPAHWEVSRMRFLCRITTGDQDTQDAKPDGQYPFFVRSETIERSNRYCFDGEGVFTSGDGAGVGKIFHYFKGKCAIHQRVYLFHKFTTITGKFFFHFLKSKLEPVVLSQSAKSTVDSLRLPMLQNFWMTCPPDKEQHSICEYLKRFEQESSTLLEECRKSIGLLKERRSALISAAVTGKIDVRGWQPPEDESAFAESGTENIEATV